MTDSLEAVYRALLTVQASMESSLENRSRPTWGAAKVMLNFAVDTSISHDADSIEACMVLSQDLLGKTVRLSEGKAFAAIAHSILESALVCLVDPEAPMEDATRLGQSLGVIILSLRNYQGAPSNLRLEVACCLRDMYSAFASSDV